MLYLVINSDTWAGIAANQLGINKNATKFGQEKTTD